MALGKTGRGFYKLNPFMTLLKRKFHNITENYNFKHDSYLFDVRMAIAACFAR